MAFISQITLNESVYESPFSLSYSEDGNVRGIYYPKLEDEGDETQGLVHTSDKRSFLTGGGLAIMTGKVIYRVANSSLIRGQWKHVIGPRDKGDFELLVNANVSCAIGWWSDANSDVRHEWKLSAQDLGLSSSTWNTDLIMERWGICSCWLFLVLTLIQFYMFIFDTASSVSMNFTFYIVYTIAYMSFLIYYEYTDAAPSVMYMFGILLYTCGYAFFAELYNIDALACSRSSSYLAGSLNFLFGSALLVYALWDWGISNLLSGSILFLLGSVAFSIDGSGYYPAMSQNLCFIGYSTFSLGRVCFLFGCQTPRCDIFFRDRAEEYSERKQSMAHVPVFVSQDSLGSQADFREDYDTTSNERLGYKDDYGTFNGGASGI